MKAIEVEGSDGVVDIESQAGAALSRQYPYPNDCIPPLHQLSEKQYHTSVYPPNSHPGIASPPFPPARPAYSPPSYPLSAARHTRTNHLSPHTSHILAAPNRTLSSNLYMHDSSSGVDLAPALACTVSYASPMTTLHCNKLS